jgi:hypothetical protein
MRLLLKFFADLRLTVVLLGLSIVMIFFGTLDQTNIGIKGTLEKYFEGNILRPWENFTTWQYPEEWPMGTRMVLALAPNDSHAGDKGVDLVKLKSDGYKFSGYNDNTFYEQALKVYRKADLDGPDLKFPDLTAIKQSLTEGDGSLKRTAVLPVSSLIEDKAKGVLAIAFIKGVPPFTLRWIHIPVVGGYILGPLLFINLLCAHFTRFKLTWKKLGVSIIHIGLVIMLVSELVTDLTDRESLMVIEEGETATYSTDFDKNELVIIDQSKPRFDSVLSVPVEQIEKAGALPVSQHGANFPFTIVTKQFFPNTDIEFLEEGKGEGGFPFQIGKSIVRANPKKVPKTYEAEKINFVSAVIEVKAGDETYGPYFVSNRLGFFEDYRKHRFEHEGIEYAIDLRRTRYNYGFGVRLDDFRFLRYPGTETAKDFTSDVTLLHGKEGEEKRIYMNHPLIHDGNTFFQSGWNEKTEKGTRLQVVQNPGKSLPYVGVAVVGLGLLVQFSMHLGRFTKRRTREQQKEATS